MFCMVDCMWKNNRCITNNIMCDWQYMRIIQKKLHTILWEFDLWNNNNNMFSINMATNNHMIIISSLLISVLGGDFYIIIYV